MRTSEKETINMPEEIRPYMKQSTEEQGSHEWFQDAFCAVTRSAIDNAEAVAQEFRKVFASKIDDEEELEAVIGDMLKQAGLASLG